MKLPNVTSRKSLKIIVIIIIIFILTGYFILGNYGFHTDPVIRFLLSGIDSYLLLIEKLSNQLLQWTCSNARIHHHMIVFHNEQLYGIDSGLLMKKWTILLLLLIWLTPASLKRKILLSGVLITTNVLFGTIDIALLAQCTVSGYDEGSSPKIARTFGNLVMISLYFIWIRQNKDYILKILGRLNLNTELIGNKINEIIIVLFVFNIAANFLYGYLNFPIWKHLTITSVQKILSTLGFDAVIETNYLVGEYGTVYIDKPCLGYSTILKFAVIVYLTGINNLRRWSFIIAGFIFLNILNVLRLLLIFIYLQKHGDYELSMHFHNLSKYVVYGIVFILWVIWFEFFTDIGPIIRKKTDTSSSQTKGIVAK